MYFNGIKVCSSNPLVARLVLNAIFGAKRALDLVFNIHIITSLAKQMNFFKREWLPDPQSSLVSDSS